MLSKTSLLLITLHLIFSVSLSTTQLTPSLSEDAEWIEENNEKIETLPVAQALVDGENSDLGAHPWHVGMVREESKTGFMGWIRHLGGLLRTTTYCGATMINPRWLITAAHCIRPQDRPVDLRVVMGSSKRAKYFYYFWQTDSIDEIHIHPDYNSTSHIYDIALLHLKVLPDLEPSELWPVCLPEEDVESYAGTRATVVGWGKTSGSERKSSARILQELGVTVISQEECQRQWSYGKGRVNIGGPKMCFRSDGASCHGDSGGGMYQETEAHKKELIGVCSYGLADCQNWAPEVYTKVSTVLDWIRTTIGIEDLNMENCGVTNPRDRNTETWIEKAKKFFDGRQVY